eukprot:6212111-Pleurochrysis_carterae.AAC.10
MEHARNVRQFGGVAIFPACFFFARRTSASLGLPASLLRATTSSSIESIFEIQNADPRSGESLRWSTHVKLLHVPSGRLLALNATPRMVDDATETLFDVTVAVKQQPDTSLSTLSREMSTSFELVPQYPPVEPQISTGQFFRIRHVLTGCWLHHAAPNAMTVAEQRLRQATNHQSLLRAVARLQALWRGHSVR